MNTLEHGGIFPRILNLGTTCRRVVVVSFTALVTRWARCLWAEGCVREKNLLSFRKIEPRLSGRQDCSLFTIQVDSGGKFNILGGDSIGYC